MLTLALATSGDLCGVAVRDGAGTVAERAFRHRMRLSERLLDEVAAVLRDADVSLRSIDALGVDIGPGSFTGVRVGVMTVKTLSDVLSKPVAGITSQEALAAENPCPPGTLVLTVVRARPGTVYAQLFAGTGEPYTEPTATTPEELAAMVRASQIRPAGVVVCGDGLVKLGTEIRAALDATGVHATFGSVEAPRAATIARIAAVRIAAGQSDDALGLAPLYVAPPPIDPRAEQPTTFTPSHLHTPLTGV